MKNTFLLLCVLSIVCANPIGLQASGPLLLQKPALSEKDIAFTYAGQVWIVPREGGEAHLLTSGPGIKSGPFFSPDGNLVAFTGEYEGGNTDVYVMPSAGGVPRRLTHHPGLDRVVGWSPDSKQILFRSSRNSYSFFNRLFSVSFNGGLPRELPLPMGESGSFAPDGKNLAYVPFDNYGRFAYIAWKHYRGGKAPQIWILNFSDLSVKRVPRDNSNDSNPMWIGRKIYFLSDRNGPVSLFAYDLDTKKVEQALPGNGMDIKSASAGPGAIVYEQLGSIHLFDLASGKSTPVKIVVPADLPDVQPRFQRVAEEIVSGQLSPSGARAVFEAHGEILTVPAEKGPIRNLTNTPGVMERDPAWSPDGNYVAYFSDASGEYQLFVASADGMGEPRKIAPGNAPSFYYGPIWSPDSRKIAYTDKRLNLWYADVETGKSVKVDTDTYEAEERTLDPVWSPDSSWISYTKLLPSHMHSVFVYSLKQQKSLQLTDGLSDARFPAFDRSGRYLYFTASTDMGLTTAWLDLSSTAHPISRNAYLIVLRNNQPSPLAPESDEEKVAAKPQAGPATGPVSGKAEVSLEPKKQTPRERPDAQNLGTGNSGTTIIDFDDISQRILALPIESHNYSGLFAGKPGTIFLLEAPPVSSDSNGSSSLWRFSLSSRTPEKLLERISNFSISFDGSKVLYSKAGKKDQWCVADASMPASASGAESALKLANMEVLVDPRAEWRQEYNEVWRLERDFFYDPGLHGVNLQQARDYYERYLENLGSRSDFSYLLADMLGEFSVGHMVVRTPSDPASGRGKVGLLGADYVIENGRYRFAKIYQGDNWNPDLTSPLTQPGVNVRQGEYLLAVNGRELHSSDEIFEFFQGLAGKPVVLKIAATAAGENAREVVVTPIGDESALRNRAWLDANRRKVDQLSDGQLAYVYLPDTGPGGYSSFNRYFFSQLDRKGAVIDERFNDGGAAADYFIDYLRRPLQNYWMTREGQSFTTPMAAIFGPKVMITNMFAGSGGDVLPWYFREAKLGPLVGTRTWGGLIGVYDTPALMDGTGVTAPRIAFYTPEGKWDIENHGVDPDYAVDLMPRDWVNGRDPQLEKAVALLMDSVNRNPARIISHPAFPNYHLNNQSPVHATATAIEAPPKPALQSGSDSLEAKRHN